MKKTFLFLAFAVLQHFAFAQTPSKKTFSIPLATTILPAEIKEDFHPVLQNLEAPFPGGESERALLAKLRSEPRISPLQNASGVNSEANKAIAAPLPWVGKQIDGNRVYEGLPNDNDMAISNGGKIVSVINSNIFMYDLITDTITNAAR